MDKEIEKLPGYQVYEYKLILVPHEDLALKILEIKKTFKEKFAAEYTGAGVPQLILASFKQVRAFQDRITNRLHTVAMALPPVKIELKDFGSFPSHTIFINVTSRLQVTELVKKIRTETQRLMKMDAENKPHFMTDAHLTIARKLKPWQYEQAWLEFSHKQFTGKFIAKSMVLLGRKEGDIQYKPIQSFEFENLPVDTVQGQLF